ncbi:MAG: tRNA uridine-5-carboxymethylaminomethyl(34) synthesis GTPase MnmE [Bacteroidaceae bacterium]|nr:tRNA uridine-5-carboxymethylaminomethyl(34) synthesis GTPase MnmE [Bacteroidaceae bacterium]
MSSSSTICAISTAQGGAIGIVRVSGPQAIQLTDSLFKGCRRLVDAEPYSVLFGRIIHDGEVIDEVLATIFRAPHSYTGEDSVELSCHGSSYILQRILSLLISQGCTMAQPGEFTQRAFLNGKMDLSQAEAVADLIASSNAATHRVAMNQMRGGITHRLAEMRQQLLTLTSLLELELDFSEEDVEFADRQQLQDLSRSTLDEIEKLRSSFSSGNAIKNGIHVAIIGAPNVGKSTLLNQLLQDDKAIVSDIQGTTRDLIEDTITLGGYLFRFIDTAGIRHTSDVIERLGIERSIQAAEKAHIIILLSEEGVSSPTVPIRPDQFAIHVLNKADRLTSGTENTSPHASASESTLSLVSTLDYPTSHLSLSALTGQGLDTLRQSLIDHAHLLCGELNEDTVLITNQRHLEALELASSSMRRALDGILHSLPGDLIAEDLRLVLSHLSTILGSEITTDEVLGNIFKNFCIGK